MLPLIFAHRGARSVAPENTLPAFAAALDLGADGIELDVQCSADGVLVVMHNFSVDEITGAHGAVGSFTAAQLAALDAGSHFSPAFAGVGVPTLDQVLDLVGDRCLINVEIKSADPEGGPEVERLAATVAARRLYDQVIVSSFNPITLIKLRWVAPRIRLGLLYGQDLPGHLRRAWTSPILAPEALHPHHALIDEEHMAWARGCGCQVNTWTVNEPAEARRLADLGVDTLISDVPDFIRAALQQPAQHRVAA
jgi:glycerophosphoryl diester phosphodiesterase